MHISVGEIRQKGDFISERLELNAEEDIRLELSRIANVISHYIISLEAEIERSMLNAAWVLYELDRISEGTLTLEELEQIRQNTGMSDLYLTDIDGVFILSTEPEALGISLFDIGEHYRMLVTGESDYIPSTLTVKAETGEIFKFTAIPRADNRGVLESALDASVIEQSLQRFFYDYEGLRTISLFDINLITLTSNYAEGVLPAYNKGERVPYSTTEIDAFFNDSAETLILMGNRNAQIYHPVTVDGNARYVLSIDFDTTSYFAIQNLISDSVSDLVRESSYIKIFSFAIVIVIFLIFTVIISIIIGKLIKKIEEAQSTTTSMFEANPQINVLFDENFKVVDCNQAALNFMQFNTKEEMNTEFVERLVKSIPELQPDGQVSVSLREGLITAAKEGYMKFDIVLTIIDERKKVKVELIRIPYENSFAIIAYVDDITDIYLREKELIDAHKLNEFQLSKLNLTLRAAKIGLWDMEVVQGDPINPKNIFTWSDEFRRMVGFKNEIDFPNILSSWSDCLHPDDKEKTLDALAKHLLDTTGKTPYNVEYRLKKKNGEYGYYHAFGETTRDKNGNAVRVAGSLIDITEKKQMEEEIAITDERVKIMLNATPLCCELWDSNFNIIDCNEETLNFFGVKNKQEFLNRIFDFTPEYQPDGRRSDEKVEMLLTKTLDEGRCVFDWMHLLSDGTLVPVESTLVKMDYKDDYVIAAYSRDLREQIRLKKEIEIMFENAPVGLTSFDENFKFIDCNEAVLEIYGVTREFYSNFFGSAAHSPEFQPDGSNSREKAMKIIEQVMDGEKIKIDWVHCTPDGKPLPVELTMVRMHRGDKYIGLGYIYDMREQIRMKEEVETACEQATIANKAKSAFLSTVSHEIRTPMNAILGIAEIQLQNETLEQSIRDGLEKIYISGDMLLSIINDILDFSKIDAGKLELFNVNYETASLINDTAQLNMMRIISKPIEFKLDIDENMPVVLFGDELRVKQILNNLLSNAFKYTANGTVTLSVSAEECEDNSGIIAVFKVIDTGQGMSKEQVDRLFDEYSRFNMEANRTTDGIGLGMSITRNLVRMMNGTITVESMPEKGSVFTVRLPQGKVGPEKLGKEIIDNLKEFRVHNRARMKHVQITRSPMPYGNVLIVDDVENNIYVAKGLMVPYALNVDSADSGFAAIEKIKSGNFYDVIFMDQMMPKMDGVEATKILREMGYTNPIVALTANAMLGQADVFLENGFDDFVSKPIDIRHLNAVLNKLIRDKQPPEIIEAAEKQAKLKNIYADSEPNPPIDPNFAEIVVRDIKKALVTLDAILKKNAPYSNEDMQSFTIQVHGMKSTLANIGKTALSDIAFKLEQSGRDNNIGIIISETPVFLNSLRAIVDELTPHEGTLTCDKTDIDKTYLKERLLAIKAACEEYDKNSADEVLKGLRKMLWPQQIKELLDEISKLLLHSDFFEIMEHINNAIEKNIF